MKLLALITTGCFTCAGLYGQQKQQVVVENSAQPLVYSISAYSVDADKKLQKNFKENGEYRVVYTCIPAGILVVTPVNQQKIIQSEFSSLLQTWLPGQQVVCLVNCTMQEAEKKCSEARNK